MRYVIENKEIKMEKKEIARRQFTANQLVEDFEPTKDEFDRRILFEIAKRRVHAEDYCDDTSYEEDLDFSGGDEGGFRLGKLFGTTAVDEIEEEDKQATGLSSEEVPDQ